jgi:hypothetical protein
LANFGTTLACFLINHSLLSVHVSGRNYPDLHARFSQREGYVQQASLVGSGMISIVS